MKQMSVKFYNDEELYDAYKLHLEENGILTNFQNRKLIMEYLKAEGVIDPDTKLKTHR